MKLSRYLVPVLAALFLAVVAAAGSGAAAVPGDVNAALGKWLPDPNTGFEAWRKGQVAAIEHFDYFVCAPDEKPTADRHSLSFAGSACKALTYGTPFSYGPAGPNKGTVVYDRVHDLLLYSKGCCAERGVAFTSGSGKPPTPVSGANLILVRTARGVSLGMTQAQVLDIYGPTQAHAAKSAPGITTLSYTTMKGTPSNSSDSCGQFQTFSFRKNRLVSIELLAGC